MMHKDIYEYCHANAGSSSCIHLDNSVFCSLTKCTKHDLPCWQAFGVYCQGDDYEDDEGNTEPDIDTAWG
jgi:hypothetical protein